MTIYDTNCEHCGKHFENGDDMSIDDKLLCVDCENNENLQYNNETYKWEEL